VRLTAQEVIDRVATAYATCGTYRDTGCVRVVTQSGGVETLSERPFSTAFVRPDRFRFAFTSESVAGKPDLRYVICREGKAVRTWWDLRPGVERPADLEDALSTAKGASGRASHTVPALLLPKETHKSLTALTGLKRLGDAKADRRDCFRLDGVYGITPLSFWIDKESLLLLKVEEYWKSSDGRVVRTATTTYDPTVDGEVGVKLLEFDPPK